VLTKTPKFTTRPNLAVVPDKSIAASYVNRTIDGKTDFETFDFALAEKMNVLIEGPTGCGKTHATYAWGAKNRKPVASVPSNIGIEPSQMFGKYKPAEGGGFVWQDGPVTHVVRNGGVLLINEINFMPDRIATVMYGLLDSRRTITLLDHDGEVIHAHDDLLIVGDMNPDYAGTRPLNAAWRNRFAIQMAWDYDPVIEKKLVKSMALMDFAAQVRKRTVSGDWTTPLSTNMLMEFERMTKQMGLDFAVGVLVNHFTLEERAPMKKVIEPHFDNLKRDLLGVKAVVPEVEDDGEDSGEVPDFMDEDGRTWKAGDVDDEFGVYGKDWTFREVEEDEEGV
jgi:hypothetical protein